MFARLIQTSLLTCSFTIAQAAFADDTAPVSNGSEFMHQTEGGKFEVTPATLLGVGTVKYNDTNSGFTNLKADSLTTPLAVGAEYGITSMLSVGLGLAYYNTHQSYTCDVGPCPKSAMASGLNNPELDIKARFPVGTGTIRVGAQAFLTLSKSKIDSSGNANEDSGGTTVTPYVGYELPLGPGFLGARATYELYKGDRKQTDDRVPADYTIKGGAEFDVSAFYEANVGIMTYGGALVYGSAAQSKSTTNGVDSDNKDATTSVSVEFYTPAHFTPTITLLPVLGFGSVTYTSTAAPRDSATEFFLGVGGRFAF